MEIRLKNISKFFDDTLAVKNLDISIENGQLISILGPSGCGKSTTLSMIAGLENPTSGEIYFDNEKVNEVPAERRDVGMVFQNYALYPHMSVFKNIMFPLKMKKIDKNESKERIIEIANLMKIENLMKRKVTELSGGQQQRVAIARALVKRPKILLLDEPLSNLDARLRIELREEIRNVQQKMKITTVFVTHDQEEAMSISDKILLMDSGLKQQYSTPKDMYIKPNNRFVASFLGNPPMNFFEEKQNFFKKLNFDADGIVLGIRPEDFSIVEKEGYLHGEIVSIQTLGKEVYIKILHEETYFTVCARWNYNYEVGQKINLEIRKIYIFDSKGVCRHVTN